jgi:hypothetical protein
MRRQSWLKPKRNKRRKKQRRPCKNVGGRKKKPPKERQVLNRQYQVCLYTDKRKQHFTHTHINPHLTGSASLSEESKDDDFNHQEFDEEEAEESD